MWVQFYRGNRSSLADKLSEKRINIVIPAYNEDQAVGNQIESILSVMNRTDWDYRIIMVNDGSTDETLHEIQKFDVDVINKSENHGYGEALKSGIREADSEFILITDADGTYPSDIIPELLSKIEEYDMVVGSRTGEKVHIPLLRKPAKYFLRLLSSYLTGIEIPDLNSGLRVMRKSVVEKYYAILPSGFSFTTTITIASLCDGYRVHYHPINYANRVGNSKIRPVDTFHFLILILKAMIRFRPLKFFIPLGFAFLIAGFLNLQIGVSSSSNSAVFWFCMAASFLSIALGFYSNRLVQFRLNQTF